MKNPSLSQYPSSLQPSSALPQSPSPHAPDPESAPADPPPSHHPSLVTNTTSPSMAHASTPAHETSAADNKPAPRNARIPNPVARCRPDKTFAHQTCANAS